MHPDEPLLNEYVDDALDAARRSEIDEHLDGCARCRHIVDELREIRSVAASLDPRDPPVRAWMRLERAIKLEAERPLVQPAHGGRVKGPSRSVLLGLAAAAALLLATAGGMWWMSSPARHAAVPRAASADKPAAAPAEAARSVEMELREAEAHYENAIKGLEQIAAAEQSVFDPRTAATLQKNLAVIDQAINESRAALRSQPTSEPAQQSLLENFKAKMALLQDTVSLINEMRKGNEAGAARIVSGLKQKGD